MKQGKSKVINASSRRCGCKTWRVFVTPVPRQATSTDSSIFHEYHSFPSLSSSLNPQDTMSSLRTRRASQFPHGQPAAGTTSLSEIPEIPEIPVHHIPSSSLNPSVVPGYPTKPSGAKRTPTYVRRSDAVKEREEKDKRRMSRVGEKIRKRLSLRSVYGIPPSINRAETDNYTGTKTPSHRSIPRRFPQTPHHPTQPHAISQHSNSQSIP